ncbi:hypothetical protein L1049_026644 [Liquidambar formosana]|uniref:Glucosamine/galactosamine-6-phosphate isomerase domain-containing protein n=1 Tax=Liquidambar formosana TaxID=63359 RepID=A0AAP0NFX7_LIQFO
MEKREAEVRLFDSSEELSSCLADYVVQISDIAVKERGAFSLVLSGGDLAERLGKLASVAFLKTVDWSKWHVFWAEENVVAKRHPEAYTSKPKKLLSPSIMKSRSHNFLVPIPPAHVISVSHGVAGESAAETYEFSIRQQIRKRRVPVSPSSDCPMFDLVLLALGTDGQVASLFPNHPVLKEETQWVSWISSKDAPRESVISHSPRH